MDAVSHIALGVAVAEAGFRHRLGGKSVVLGAACGLFPDIDLVARLAGEWGSIFHHRGLTHSVFVVAALAPAAGWIGYRWSGRKERPGTWIHLAFWTLVAHALLDACTSYGTQLFAPVSRYRVCLDAVSIVDVLYTIPLLAVVLTAMLRRPDPVRRRRIAASVLACTTAYLTFGLFQSRGAVAAAEVQLRAAGFAPVRVRAIPMLLMVGPFRVVARDGRGNLRVGHASSFVPRDIRFHRLDRPDDPAVDRVLESPRGRIFVWAASGMVHARVVYTDDGRTRVLLSDMRYGLLTRPARGHFRARAEMDRYGRLEAFRLVHSVPALDLGAELKAMFRLTFTGRAAVD